MTEQQSVPLASRPDLPATNALASLNASDWRNNGSAWTAVSLLTPLIPAILVADLVLLSLMGVHIPTLSTAALRANTAQMPAAFDFFWVTFAFALIVSAKLVAPSTLALLFLHAFARLIGWIRWWAYGIAGATIGGIAGTQWSDEAMASNAAFCAAFGALSAIYLWGVLYAPRKIRWTVVAVVFLPAAAATIGSLGTRLVATVL